METDKFQKSVDKFKNTLMDISHHRRVTQRLPDNFIEHSISQGKRMRLEDITANTGAQSTSSLRPMHPPSVQYKTAGKDDDKAILIYPPRQGGTPLLQKDLGCLEEGEYLGDRVMNIMVSCAYESYLTKTKQAQVQVCDSFMFAQLTRGAKPREVTNSGPFMENFRRVQRYRRQKPPGTSPITLLPICVDHHWILLFVAIEIEEAVNKVTILTADSLPTVPREYVANVIQWFLEYSLPGQTHTTKVNLQAQRQTNGYDCGLHAIHNSKRILQHLSDVKIYHPPE